MVDVISSAAATTRFRLVVDSSMAAATLEIVASISSVDAATLTERLAVSSTSLDRPLDISESSLEDTSTSRELWVIFLIMSWSFPTNVLNPLDSSPTSSVESILSRTVRSPSPWAMS